MSLPATPATEPDESSSRSTRITVSNWIAQTAAGPLLSAKRGPVYLPASLSEPEPRCRTPAAPEFHLPDERRYHLLWRKCPECGFSPSHLWVLPNQSLPFYIACSDLYCQFKTPAFKSSQDAIRYWNALCLLTKP